MITEHDWATTGIEKSMGIVARNYTKIKKNFANAQSILADEENKNTLLALKEIYDEMYKLRKKIAAFEKSKLR